MIRKQRRVTILVILLCLSVICFRRNPELQENIKLKDRHVKIEVKEVKLKDGGDQNAGKSVKVKFRDFENQNVTECGCTRKFILPPSSSGKQHQDLNSTCSDEGTFFATNQSVVSFSFYIPPRKSNIKLAKKKEKVHQRGIELNLKKMREFYPGYTMRIYTDVSLQGKYCDLICENSDLFWCDIRKTPSLGDQSSMFFMTWRFLVLGDPTVDIFLSRDLDSVITPREAAVVQDWLHHQDKKAIHLMRDKRGSQNARILGGLWGARNSLLGGDAIKIQEEIVSQSRNGTKSKPRDQTILAKVLFEKKSKYIAAYDSYHCEQWRNYTVVRAFPTERKVEKGGGIRDFVGNVNMGKAKYFDFSPCPVECRPSYGKNWTFC